YTVSIFVNNDQKRFRFSYKPIEHAVFIFEKFYAGNAFNIIADQAHIEGTVRALNPDVRVMIEKEIRHILDGLKMSNHIDYELDYLHGYPVLVNDPLEEEKVKEIFTLIGDYEIIERNPDLGV